MKSKCCDRFMSEIELATKVITFASLDSSAYINFYICPGCGLLYNKIIYDAWSKKNEKS